MIFSFLSALVANLAAFSVTSYIESIFKLTSSFKLSELADRNHPALRHLEDKALGTFNHSLVVGTLADRAANKIGANSQLARAMAYYHDLGKTLNPTMFVENQIGATNPHDRLLPMESANIIKNHVVDGIKLAKKFKIPDTPFAFSPMGRHVAKINLRYIKTLKEKEKNLVLVTAITPTPAGEGKTTTSVGLNDGLNKIGMKSIVCLREPSLGPSFGMKGGAAGGGYAQVVPMERINLHFTGDFHAITTVSYTHLTLPTNREV